MNISRSRRGFTLVEALIATALVGFSLIVMFGFHSQAVRSNMHARKMTDCTYLAQLQMERLMALPWTSASRHDDLQDVGADVTSTTSPWEFFEHAESWSGDDPTVINAGNQTTATLGKPIYYLSWAVDDPEDVDSTLGATWTQLKVRCQYYDDSFNRWRGTTVSSFRFRDS